MTSAPATARDAVYVFGVIESPEVSGSSITPPDGVEILEAGALAAVIGNVDAGRPIGLASDLRRHDRVVAHFVAAGVTILPMRFGAVLPERRALVDDLLMPKGRELEAALGELRGLVQYTVRVRYVREAVLNAVLRDERLAALRDAARVSGRGREAQLRLGEAVVAAIDRRRAGDAARIRRELEPLARRVECELSQDPDSVASFSCLVRRTDTEAYEAEVEDLARRHADAVELTLLGPLAPYQFVPEL